MRNLLALPQPYSVNMFAGSLVDYLEDTGKVSAHLNLKRVIKHFLSVWKLLRHSYQTSSGFTRQELLNIHNTAADAFVIIGFRASFQSVAGG